MIRWAEAGSAAALGRVRAGFRSAAGAVEINAIAASRLVRTTAIGRMTRTSVKAGSPYTDRTLELVSFETPRATAIWFDEANVGILSQARQCTPATGIASACAERIDEQCGARGPDILQLYIRIICKAIHHPVGAQHAGRQTEHDLLATLIFTSDVGIAAA